MKVHIRKHRGSNGKWYLQNKSQKQFMNKMNAQEIVDFLKTYFDGSIDRAVRSLEYENSTDEDDLELEAKIGGWEQVEKGFVDRDTQIVTYHFVNHDCFIKFSGYYSSYGDSEYDEWNEVRPVTKTIVVYE